MRSTLLLAGVLFCVAFVPLPRAIAQSDHVRDRPSLELGVNYNVLDANAPAGQCTCFTASGASGTVAMNFAGAARHFSVLADIGGSYAANVNGTTQNITLTNYLFGARYTLRRAARLGLYGQVLGGASHESSNYAYVQSATSAAVSAGGGATLRLHSVLSWNVVQADWIHSSLPNGSNNLQNDLRLSTGLFVRLFGAR